MTRLIIKVEAYEEDGSTPTVIPDSLEKSLDQMLYYAGYHVWDTQHWGRDGRNGVPKDQTVWFEMFAESAEE